MVSQPETRYARRRGSHVLHVVTGVVGWYSGKSATTECGVKHADVLDLLADPDKPLMACKRCMRSLGWDLPKSEG